jgi:hypothetical protein
MPLQLAGAHERAVRAGARRLLRLRRAHRILEP